MSIRGLPHLSPGELHFTAWRQKLAKTIKGLRTGCHPKQVIIKILQKTCLPTIAVNLLWSLYTVYQHLMDYWAETMQDDCYLIAESGWKAETYRIIEKDKKGKEHDKG